VSDPTYRRALARFGEQGVIDLSWSATIISSPS